MKGPRTEIGATAETFLWGDDQVLKLFFPDYPRSVVEAEAAITRRAQATGFPAPAVERVVEVEGRYGIILQRIEGPSMLQRLMTPPWPVAGMARLLAKLQAEVHAQAAPELPSLKERLERRVRRASGLTEGAKEAVIERLSELPDGNAVCHGDFHPGNILMSPRGPIIIDWMDTARGDPLADVARTLLLIEVGSPPGMTLARVLVGLLRSRFRRVYLRRYGQLHVGSLEGIAAWRAPIAAARLCEGFREEEAQLVAMVRAAI